MTTFELHTLLSMNRELIANTWNLFLGVHVALVAAFGVRNHVRVGKRIVLAVPFYLGFLFLNYRAQVDNYNFARTVLEQLQRIESTHPQSEAISTRVFEAGWVVGYLPHIYLASAAAVFVLVIIAAVTQPKLVAVQNALQLRDAA